MRSTLVLVALQILMLAPGQAQEELKRTKEQWETLLKCGLLSEHVHEGFRSWIEDGIPASEVRQITEWINHSMKTIASAYALEMPELGTAPHLILVAKTQTRSDVLSYTDMARQMMVLRRGVEERTVRHEAFHLLRSRLIKKTAERTLPTSLWFEEGLAEWWAGLKTGQRWPSIQNWGSLPKHLLEAKQCLDLEALLNTTSATERLWVASHEHRQVTSARAQAWVLMEFLASFALTKKGTVLLHPEDASPPGIYGKRWAAFLKTQLRSGGLVSRKALMTALAPTPSERKTLRKHATQYREWCRAKATWGQWATGRLLPFDSPDLEGQRRPQASDDRLPNIPDDFQSGR